MAHAPRDLIIVHLWGSLDPGGALPSASEALADRVIDVLDAVSAAAPRIHSRVCFFGRILRPGRQEFVTAGTLAACEVEVFTAVIARLNREIGVRSRRQPELGQQVS